MQCLVRFQTQPRFGELAEQLLGRGFGGIHEKALFGDQITKLRLLAQRAEGGVDFIFGERVVRAAEDDGLQRFRRFGVAIGFGEGAGFLQGISGHGVREGGVAFNGSGERGTALLGDDGHALTGKAECLSDGARINAAGAGSDGGEHTDAASRVGFEHAACSGFDDTDDDHRNFPCGDGFADVFEAVGGGGVAGDDDGFDRWLGELRLLALSRPESAAEEEDRRPSRSIRAGSRCVGRRSSCRRACWPGRRSR
jgi:hypothetical protein